MVARITNKIECTGNGTEGYGNNICEIKINFILVIYHEANLRCFLWVKAVTLVNEEDKILKDGCEDVRLCTGFIL